MKRVIALLVTFLLIPSVQAQEKDILGRLMSEPVTLFDWGLAQLDRDIARTAGRVMPMRIGATSRPVTGAIYEWRTRLVTLFVSAELPPAQRTDEACSETFREIVRDLTALAPRGPNAAGWYLRNAFKPKAHFLGDRFEDTGAKLLRSVRLEVSFIPATYEALRGDGKRVRCSGRLDAAPHELTFDSTS